MTNDQWKRAFSVKSLRFRPIPTRPERQLIRRLRKLDWGRGPLVIEPISGGISNHNYLVRVPRSCRCRASLPGASSPGDRPSQRSRLPPGSQCPRTGAGGRSPRAGSAGCSFRRWPHSGASRSSLSGRAGGLATLLRHLHEAWDALTGEFVYFCPFQTIRTYARSAARLKAKLPADIDALLEDARELAHRIGTFRPVLCHNDLLAANLIDDGRRLWLLDWEYAGVGHPVFDLANASANATFSDDQDRPPP